MNLTQTRNTLIYGILLAGFIFALCTPAGATSINTKVYKKVPPGCQKVTHQNTQYLFNNGHFFLPADDGFLRVKPPVGIVVVWLPATSKTRKKAGITYYVYDNVFYRKVPKGYKVVAPPRG